MDWMKWDLCRENPNETGTNTKAEENKVMVDYREAVMESRWLDEIMNHNSALTKMMIESWLKPFQWNIWRWLAGKRQAILSSHLW